MSKNVKRLSRVLSVFLVCALVFTAMPATTYAKVNVPAPRITSATTTTNSATIKWTKSSRATGYIVYRAMNRNGKYSYGKIKTLRGYNSVSFKNTNMKAGTKYRYKVRAYRVINHKTYYSNYSNYRAVTTKNSSAFKVNVYCSPETDKYAEWVMIAVTNKGNSNIVIQNYGMLSDDDYYDYDRDLSLFAWSTDSRPEPVFADTCTIAPNQTKYVSFMVDGYETWYDKFSTIGFIATYKGVDYGVLASNYYGTTYERMYNAQANKVLCAHR